MLPSRSHECGDGFFSTQNFLRFSSFILLYENTRRHTHINNNTRNNKLCNFNCWVLCAHRRVVISIKFFMFALGFGLRNVVGVGGKIPFRESASISTVDLQVIYVVWTDFLPKEFFQHIFDEFLIIIILNAHLFIPRILCHQIRKCHVMTFSERKSCDFVSANDVVIYCREFPLAFSNRFLVSWYDVIRGSYAFSTSPKLRDI